MLDQIPKTAPDTISPAENRQEFESVSLKNESVYLDVSIGIYSSRELGLNEVGEDGTTCEIVAEVGVDGQSNFAFVKTKSDFGEQLFMVGLSNDSKSPRVSNDYWIPVYEDVPIVVGRGRDAMVKGYNGEDFGPTVSREQLTILLNKDQLELSDSSKNGSVFRGQLYDKDQEYNYTAGHTVSAEWLARRRGHLREDDKFAGRPTINRDTFPIDGHVDIRSWQAGGEAIVVDSERYPKEFNELYERFNSRLGDLIKKKGEIQGREELVLRAIYEAVGDTLEYDLEFVKRLNNDLFSNNNSETRKVALNTYLHARKGVCRHMALAVSWLGGRAQREGLLQGRFTTEVNQNDNSNDAHEWSRYTSPSGEVHIIDVAQHYFGKIDETVNKKRSGTDYWGYFRSKQERDYYRKLQQERVANASGRLASQKVRRD